MILPAPGAPPSSSHENRAVGKPLKSLPKSHFRSFGSFPGAFGLKRLALWGSSHLEDHPTFSTEAILDGFTGGIYHIYNSLEDHPIIARNGEHLPMVSQKVP